MRIRYLILLFLLFILSTGLILQADQSFSIRQELDRSKYHSGQTGHIKVWASNNMGWNAFLSKAIWEPSADRIHGMYPPEFCDGDITYHNVTFDLWSNLLI